jgi:hypothetical protein
MFVINPVLIPPPSIPSIDADPVVIMGIKLNSMIIYIQRRRSQEKLFIVDLIF